MKFLIITDTSNGISEKIIERFLGENWFVISLSETTFHYLNIRNYKVDFSTPGWEKNILPSIGSRIRNATQVCLVHNASRQILDNDAQTIEANEFRKTTEVNIVTPLILNHTLIPYMPAGSSIIFIGAILPEKSIMQSAASNVISKHALVDLMRATCQDFTVKGIHTTCICSGFSDNKALRINRPLSKLAAAREFEGGSERRTAAYIEIREDSSTEPTNKLPGAVEFRKRSNVPEASKKISIPKHPLESNRTITFEEIANLVLYCANNIGVNGAIWHAVAGTDEDLKYF